MSADLQNVSEAAWHIERLLTSIFTDWRNVEDKAMTEDEREARAFLRRLGR